MMRAFTAAAIQLAPVPGPLSPEAVRKNLDKCVDFTRRCVDATGAELVVLPESATTGFTPDCSVEELWDLVSEIPGPVTEPVQQVARDLGVYAVLGTYERGPERGVVYNSSVLIDRSGEVIGVYRKTHPFCTEHVDGGGWVTPGDTVTVCDTDLGRIGMIICFDGDYPELSRIQAVQGAEVICRPSRAAAVGRHLGAHLAGAGLRQPRVRHRRQRHRHRPGRGALLRQLPHRHAQRAHRRQGRLARGLGVGPARPRHRPVVAHARAPTSARASTTCATATST